MKHSKKTKFSVFATIIVSAFILGSSSSDQNARITINVLDSQTNQPVDSVFVKLRGIDNTQNYEGYTDTLGSITFAESPTSVPTNENLPKTFLLSTPYPQPAKNQTKIEIFLPTNEEVEISLYNILGQRIISYKQNVSPGIYATILNLNQLATGMYIVTFRAGELFGAEKIMKVSSVANSLGGIRVHLSPIANSHALNKTSKQIDVHAVEIGTFELTLQKQDYITYSDTIAVQSDTTITAILEKEAPQKVNVTMQIRRMLHDSEPVETEVATFFLGADTLVSSGPVSFQVDSNLDSLEVGAIHSEYHKLLIVREFGSNVNLQRRDEGGDNSSKLLIRKDMTLDLYMMHKDDFDLAEAATIMDFRLDVPAGIEIVPRGSNVTVWYDKSSNIGPETSDALKIIEEIKNTWLDSTSKASAQVMAFNYLTFDYQDGGTQPSGVFYQVSFTDKLPDPRIQGYHQETIDANGNIGAGLAVFNSTLPPGAEPILVVIEEMTAGLGFRADPSPSNLVAAIAKRVVNGNEVTYEFTEKGLLLGRFMYEWRSGTKLREEGNPISVTGQLLANRTGQGIYGEIHFYEIAGLDTTLLETVFADASGTFSTTIDEVLSSYLVQARITDSNFDSNGFVRVKTVSPVESKIQNLIIYGQSYDGLSANDITPENMATQVQELGTGSFNSNLNGLIKTIDTDKMQIYIAKKNPELTSANNSKGMFASEDQQFIADSFTNPDEIPKLTGGKILPLTIETNDNPTNPPYFIDNSGFAIPKENWTIILPDTTIPKAARASALTNNNGMTTLGKFR